MSGVRLLQSSISKQTRQPWLIERERARVMLDSFNRAADIHIFNFECTVICSFLRAEAAYIVWREGKEEEGEGGS
jgi:hypothetical protein